MIASQFGAQAPVSLPLRRLFVGFDRASGDHVPGGDVETFNQLFPLGHAYLGFIDPVGRQNVTAVSFGVDTKPFRGITVAVAEHNFWLADTDDALWPGSYGREQLDPLGTLARRWTSPSAARSRRGSGSRSATVASSAGDT